ncbi:MAG TPA: hydantoinase/oxoprolinase family protein [Pirellulaceae bacterium]|nr:hydantoinase/oxoprolinase family protein [Pirellulaceae bacterium]
MSQWIGLDIGGANLKVADIGGRAECHPFPLWLEYPRLAAELVRVLGPNNPDDRLAVTMTGELCDCFPTKSAGVKHIVDQVLEAFPGRNVVFYQVNGSFVDAAAACRDWQSTAASNWHALARWGARYLPGQSGILVDMGSTTTDIIPLVGGEPRALGQTDWTRMLHRELVYSGVGRTPVSGVLPNLMMMDVQAGTTRAIPLAQELFATMQDVYLVLRDVPESESHAHTADHRPADIVHARRRLARLCCADEPELEHGLIETLARQAARAQSELIGIAVKHVMQRDWSIAGNWLVSGSGAWLAQRMIAEIVPGAYVISLAECVSPMVSTAAPAWAVAHLAWETAACGVPQ